MGGWLYYFSRQYDQAAEECRKVIEMDPSFASAHRFLGWAYVQEAIAEFQQAVSLSPGDTPALADLGHAYAVSGQRAEAAKVLDELKGLSKRRYIGPHHLALI